MRKHLVALGLVLLSSASYATPRCFSWQAKLAEWWRGIGSRPRVSRRTPLEVTPVERRVLPSGYGLPGTHVVTETVSVEIRVTGPDGKPIAGAHTSLSGGDQSPTGSQGFSSLSADVNGIAYGYSGSSQALTVTVTDKGYFPEHLSFSVDVNGLDQSEDFPVRLQPIAPYVNGVYSHVLGRQPTTTEMSHFEKQGQHSSPGNIARHILSTPEGGAARVRLFADSLHLSLSAAEVQSAGAELAAGRPERKVFEEILHQHQIPIRTIHSQEYLGQTVALYYRELAPARRLPASDWEAGVRALEDGNQLSLILSILTSDRFLNSVNNP